MIKRHFITIFLLISIYTLSAQNYIWPTSAGRQLSSTFGEYRPGHFHAGIDIKTNYTVGYPVFAIGDGYIWRVRTSPFGYGKAIYIKMKDGKMAVYGHLDEFIRPIAAYVKSEQILQKRYSTDIYFRENDLRVSRGDSIGYTGSSGTKFPHLHFEIRDENNRLINPLNTNLKITDFTIPTITSIAVVPINTSSRINGSPGTQIFDAEYIHKKIFRIDENIVVHGKVAIEIKAHDTVRGVPNQYNPYGIKMFVDDSLYFQVQYDLFDFDETRMVNIDLNYQLYQEGAGLYNRLWMYDTSNVLRFYSQSVNNGILDLTPGKHDIKIDVFDRNFNTSTLNFVLQVADVFHPNLDKFERTKNGYTAVFNINTTDSVDVNADWVYENGSVLQAATIDSIHQDSTQLTVFFTGQDAQPNEIYQIALKSQQSNLISTYYFNLSPKNEIESTPPALHFIHYPKTFLCEITFPDIPEMEPGFFVQTAQDLLEFKSTALSPEKYLTDPIPRSLFDKVLAFEWRYNHAPLKIYRVPANFNRIIPGSTYIIKTPDSLMTATFNSSSTYDTMINWIDKTSLKNIESPNLVSVPYTLYPFDQPLKSDISVQFKLPASEDNLEQIGLYQWDQDEWNYIDNQQKADPFIITAKIAELGTLALLKDTEAPLITNIYPGNRGRFRTTDVSLISATIKDELSGILDDNAIIVSLDDQILYAEYNAPQDLIRYKLSQRLSTGLHTLTISAIDRANNKSTITGTFTVY